MQGDADWQYELLDVEAIVGHLLPARSVFAFLAEHRSRLFRRACSPISFAIDGGFTLDDPGTAPRARPV